MASPVRGTSPLFVSPTCLIQSGSNGRLEIDQAILQQVAALDKKLVVVAIAGQYRTGKSYLLNRLAGKKLGFPLGSTIQSKTKGIWIWARTHPELADRYLVLLDTEGLGDVNKGDATHDCWIFSLAVLLSSVLVYNCLGTITEDSLGNLNLIAEMSNHIRTRVNKINRSPSRGDEQYFPDFIYVLRDFCMELDVQGKDVSENEYLEHCLMLKQGKGDKTDQQNMSRKSIQRYIKKRTCFTFDRPVGRRQLKNLENVEDSELSADFLKDSNRFCDYIFSHGVVKKSEEGMALDGQMWAKLVTSYVDAIRSGAVPCIENPSLLLATTENNRAMEEGVALYQKILQKVYLPTPDTRALFESHTKAQCAAIDHFHNNSYGQNKLDMEKKLNEKINEVYQKSVKDNQRASRELCQAKLRKLEQSIIAKVKEGRYCRRDGYTEYMTDVRKVERQYNEDKGLGVMASEQLILYLDRKMQEGQVIINAEKQIVEKERRIEAEKQRVLEAERKKQEAKKERDLAEKRAKEHQEKLLKSSIRLRLIENTGGPPSGALALGHQNDGAGAHYCAVAHTKWGDIPGKAKGNTCWYPYDGKENTTSNFAWMCAPNAKASWLLTENAGRPPHNAVVLGRQVDGAGSLYCAVAHTRWGDIPGKAKDNTCWYPYGGKEYTTSHFAWVGLPS